MGTSKGERPVRADRIRLILMDVDGVLTDGRIWLSSDGEEHKSFDVKDGAAIVRARRAGLKIAWVSGRRSRAVEQRAEELGVGEIHQGIVDKGPVFAAIMIRHDCTRQETAYLGDDRADAGLFRLVGMGIAPADAHPAAAAAADYVTSRPGGRGAVMEALGMLLDEEQEK